GGGLEPPKWEIRGLYNRSLAVSQCFWRRGRPRYFREPATAFEWPGRRRPQPMDGRFGQDAGARRALPESAGQLPGFQKDKTRWTGASGLGTGNGKRLRRLYFSA